MICSPISLEKYLLLIISLYIYILCNVILGETKIKFEIS